jgi:hypothetical protein
VRPGAACPRPSPSLQPRTPHARSLPRPERHPHPRPKPVTSARPLIRASVRGRRASSPLG